MDFYSILGFFPITLLNVCHTSGITLGVRALSYPWAILGGAYIVSGLMSYTRGHVREMFLICAAMMTAFTAALAHSNPNNSVFTVTIAKFAAFGNGALVVPSLTLALYASPDNHMGTTAALSLSSRFLGGSIGTAIYFNVFNNQIKKKLELLIEQAEANTGLPQTSYAPLIKAMVPANFATLVQQVPGVMPRVLEVATYARQWVFADALKYVWYTTIPFGVIGMLFCVFLPNIRKYMTSRVAVVSNIMVVIADNVKIDSQRAGHPLSDQMEFGPVIGTHERRECVSKAHFYPSTDFRAE